MTFEGRSTARYARAVERALSRGAGRPIVISPRDYALCERWAREGVPLAVVVTAIREARARGREVASLGPIARRVEETFAHVREGRLAGTSAAAAPVPAPSASRSDLPDAIREIVDEADRRAANGASPESVDRFVDDALEAAAPAEAVAAAREETEIALRGHRGRMGPDALDRTRRRGIVDRLRSRWGIRRRILDA